MDGIRDELKEKFYLFEELEDVKGIASYAVKGTSECTVSAKDPEEAVALARSDTEFSNGRTCIITNMERDLKIKDITVTEIKDEPMWQEYCQIYSSIQGVPLRAYKVKLELCGDFVLGIYAENGRNALVEALGYTADDIQNICSNCSDTSCMYNISINEAKITGFDFVD